MALLSFVSIDQQHREWHDRKKKPVKHVGIFIQHINSLWSKRLHRLCRKKCWKLRIDDCETIVTSEIMNLIKKTDQLIINDNCGDHRSYLSQFHIDMLQSFRLGISSFNVIHIDIVYYRLISPDIHPISASIPSFFYSFFTSHLLLQRVNEPSQGRFVYILRDFSPPALSISFIVVLASLFSFIWQSRV